MLHIRSQFELKMQVPGGIQMQAFSPLRIKALFKAAMSPWLPLLFLIFFSSMGHGQQSAASVTGLVKDQSGASVVGATLRLRNVETNAIRETVSNATGNYTILNVPPGRYTMEFTAQGFQIEKIAEFQLSVNQTMTFDATMDVGQVNASITVQAENTGIESSTSELGGVVAQKQVHDLPLNGRNFTQLLTLSPGVTPISVAQNRSGSNTAVAPGSAFVFPSVNGQGNRENYFMVDGMDDQNVWNNTYAVAPIVDAIQEFKVNSHDNAEFGQVSGGVIDVATKSGSNAFHGSAWEYLRNNVFDARNHFQSLVTPYHQDQYGLTFGGPVWIPKLYRGRNKTFFFIAGEGFHFAEAQNTFFNVPTPAELDGDYSALLALPNDEGQLYDPRTGLPFPNNQLVDASGKSELDPGAVAFAKATLPASIVIPGSPSNNALNSGINLTTQWNYSVRLDQNLGKKDFVSVRYSGEQQRNSVPSYFLHLSNLVEVYSLQYGVSWVHDFSPTVSLQTQYARTHVVENEISRFDNDRGSSLADMYGLDPSVSTFIGGVKQMATLQITGYFSDGEQLSLSPDLSNIHQYKSNLSVTRGRHQLEMGGSWDQLNYRELNFQTVENFDPNQTSGVDAAGNVSLGDAFATFLLGYPDDINKRDVLLTERPGGIMSFYGQDSWKVNSRLTANYGLRYDRTFIPEYGKEDTVGQSGGIETGDYDFNNGTYILQVAPPACSVRLHAPCLSAGLPAHVVVSPNKKILHDTTTNWGPRFGLAYRITNVLAMRGFFGIFYDNWASAIQLPQNYNGSWPDLGALDTGQINSLGQPYVSPHNPFATVSGVLPPPTPFNYTDPVTGDFVRGFSNYFVDPKIKNAYSEQYSLGIQQQLGTDTILAVNYVGSESHRLDIGGYYNTGMPSPYPLYDPHRENQIGLNGPQANGQLFGYAPPVKSWDRSIGNGSYNALQAAITRTYRRGLAYTIAYTWGKAIDEGQSGFFGVEGNELQDPYNIRGSRGPAAYNIPQILSASVDYEIPVGKGKTWSMGNGVANYLLGNWQTNLIFLARSGQNFTVGANGDIAHTGNGRTYVRGLVQGDPHLPHPSAAEWINTAAFGLPYAKVSSSGVISEDPTIGMGNSGRNNLQDQNYYDADLSVFRQFPIRDTLHMEFRAEAFNVLNHTVLGTPNTAINASHNAFGTINSTASIERLLQFALKVTF